MHQEHSNEKQELNEERKEFKWNYWRFKLETSDFHRLKSPEKGELRRVQAPQSDCLAAPLLLLLLLRADGEEEEADDGELGGLKLVRMVVWFCLVRKKGKPPRKKKKERKGQRLLQAKEKQITWKKIWRRDGFLTRPFKLANVQFDPPNFHSFKSFFFYTINLNHTKFTIIHL